MGYEANKTDEFQVPSVGGPVDVTLVLEADLVILERAVVTGEEQPFAPGPLEGFHDRRRRNIGRVFLTREEIEQKAPVDFTDILRGIGGVRLVPTGGRGYQVVMTGVSSLPETRASRAPCGTDPFCTDPREEPIGQGGACRVNFYVDGIRYRFGSRGINEILASEVEAVEVYRRASETPAEFLSSESQCGVVAIWTKRAPRGSN